MSRNEIPKELQNHLEEFQVDVPDIPLTKSKVDRIANWIYAPVKSPIDLLNIKGNSITRLVMYPFILLLIVFITPIFFI
ncbi:MULTISPECIES: hypothetical protein [Bacillaceae]|uniref:hypothetical protein n=1 Tax=Bacillaceae TaxID=186817 RepID=UPI000BFB3E4E|nr:MULTISPECIES: hypothetical protein [Bacillaceae]PGT82764.1 hypothetical protein COD11_14170 [Bacillus sp. AFS040349]UGB33078.1 hypothetical protein LPC09_11955 [Metabacillus sp. B2-18]